MFKIIFLSKQFLYNHIHNNIVTRNYKYLLKYIPAIDFVQKEILDK
jgi:hypothetical protein